MHFGTILSNRIVTWVTVLVTPTATTLTPDSVKTRTERRNWIDTVFNELAKGQAEMHYSRHSLTSYVTYETTLTYASANDQ